MMGLVREWLLGVACTAMVLAIAQSLAPEGSVKKVCRLAGGLALLLAAVGPLLRLAVHYLVYKLAAALSATLGGGPVCALVERLGGAFGLVLGMTGACCLLLLIALVSCVSAVAA